MTAEPITKACSAEWDGKAKTVTVRFVDKASAEAFNQDLHMPRHIEDKTVKFYFGSSLSAWLFWQGVSTAIQAYGTHLPSSLIA